MVWRTSTLFAGIPCPQIGDCQAISCVFSHNVQTPIRSPVSASRGQLHDEGGSQRKRVKLSVENSVDSKPLAEQALGIKAEITHASLTKPVSPPPAQPKSLAADKPVSKINRSQTLNPRMVPKAPLSHEKRMTFLKALHTELSKRNASQKTGSSEASKQSVISLTAWELVEVSLILEEDMARKEGSNYPGAMRSQVRAYKNMSEEAWTKHIAAILPEKGKVIHKDKDNDESASHFETTLTPPVELEVLQQLVVQDQSILSPYGYITAPPSIKDTEEAALAVAMSKNFESCDRCGATFQAFPNRRMDGSLTTNGPCQYHPERLEYPASIDKTNKHLAGSGTLERFYPCCHRGQGSRGCTEHEHHVYKIKSAARLAAVMPFVETPDNATPQVDRRDREVKAVTFDCEMGYTTLGFELLRLTAVTWPEGFSLVDVLVRPLGIVLDFNTRYSGVSQQLFDSAPAYGEARQVSRSDDSTGSTLSIVNSPIQARTILCSYLRPSTPLIGHGIENDLNIIRLCHPTIVDTVLLYPHPRKLPFRHRLQNLTRSFLKREIQISTARGHDSLEDCIATGDLVRRKVQEKLASLRRAGWTVRGDELMPPKSSKRPVEAGVELGAVKRQKEVHQQSVAECLAMSREKSAAENN